MAVILIAVSGTVLRIILALILLVKISHLISCSVVHVIVGIILV